MRSRRIVRTNGRLQAGEASPSRRATRRGAASETHSAELRRNQAASGSRISRTLTGTLSLQPFARSCPSGGREGWRGARPGRGSSRRRGHGDSLRKDSLRAAECSGHAWPCPPRAAAVAGMVAAAATSAAATTARLGHREGLPFDVQRRAGCQRLPCVHSRLLLTRVPRPHARRGCLRLLGVSGPQRRVAAWAGVCRRGRVPGRAVWRVRRRQLGHFGLCPARLGEGARAGRARPEAAGDRPT